MVERITLNEWPVCPTCGEILHQEDRDALVRGEVIKCSDCGESLRLLSLYYDVGVDKVNKGQPQ